MHLYKGRKYLFALNLDDRFISNMLYIADYRETSFSNDDRRASLDLANGGSSSGLRAIGRFNSENKKIKNPAGASYLWFIRVPRRAAGTI